MKEYIIQVDEDKKDIMGGMPLIGKPTELVRCNDCVFGKREKDPGTGHERIYCYHHKERRAIDWYCASGSNIGA